MLSIWFKFWQAHFARSAHSRFEQEGEGASAAFFGFKSGAYGIFQVTGWKANCIVEAEIIGDEGRILVRKDNGLITVESFERSSKYYGYRELRRSVEERVENAPAFSPFVAIAMKFRLCCNDRDPWCVGEGTPEAPFARAVGAGRVEGSDAGYQGGVEQGRSVRVGGQATVIRDAVGHAELGGAQYEAAALARSCHPSRSYLSPRAGRAQ